MIHLVAPTGWSQVSSKAQGAAFPTAAPLQTFLACMGMLVLSARSGWVLSTLPWARSNPADPRDLQGMGSCHHPCAADRAGRRRQAGTRGSVALDPPGVLEPLELLGTLLWAGTGTRSSHGTEPPGWDKDQAPPWHPLALVGTSSPR